MAILQAANRRKILKILLNSHKDRRLATFAFTHLAMNLKGSVIDGVGEDRLPSELIVPTAEIRTDLDEFSLIERDALIYHGYTLMKSRVVKYCGTLPEESPEKQVETAPGSDDKLFYWPPRFVKLVDPAGGFHRRAIESREKLAGFSVWVDLSCSGTSSGFPRFSSASWPHLLLWVGHCPAFSC